MEVCVVKILLIADELKGKVLGELPSNREALVGIAVVRAVCGGVSQMAIYRWLHGNKANGHKPVRPDFPKPAKRIGRFRYWLAGDLLDWLAKTDPHEKTAPMPEELRKAMERKQRARVRLESRTEPAD
jgi:hypothetical protein